MKLDDIDVVAIGRAVANLGSPFSTHDVLEHAEMEAENNRHRHENQHGYHSLVGKILKRNRHELGIVETQAQTSRGSVWAKSAS